MYRADGDRVVSVFRHMTHRLWVTVLKVTNYELTCGPYTFNEKSYFFREGPFTFWTGPHNALTSKFTLRQIQYSLRQGPYIYAETVYFQAMTRYPSAEGTGRKGKFELHKTLDSQLNRTQLRIWNVRIFDLVPPSGQNDILKNINFFNIFRIFGDERDSSEFNLALYNFWLTFKALLTKILEFWKKKFENLYFLTQKCTTPVTLNPIIDSSAPRRTCALL